MPRTTSKNTDDDAARTSVDELRFDDNTPLPDDFDLDEMPANGGASVESIEAPEQEPLQLEAETFDPEITLSEPEEWTDILGEFEDLSEQLAPEEDASDAVAAVDTADALDDELDDGAIAAVDENNVVLAADEPDVIDLSNDSPLDMDTQFALQAEELGIDISGVHDMDNAEEDDDILTLEDDDELEEVDIAAAADALDDEHQDTQLDVVDDETDAEPAPLSIEDELAALEAAQLAADEATFEGEAILDSVEVAEPAEQVIPPMTEAEQTVNMMIDQDLMALAVEDKDGFASTMIIPDGDAEQLLSSEESDASATEADDSESESTPIDAGDDDELAGFESIIMEGEFVRSALDDEKRAEDAAAAAAIVDAVNAAGEEEPKESRRLHYGLVAGIIALVMLLLIQVVHQSRTTLATNATFSKTIGPLYRALGSPLQPNWNIKGWRFEATKGSTDASTTPADTIEDDSGEDGGEDSAPASENITIYSRLGNKSQSPLPYPLISISLTDRFEETIGSRILDPAEYLSNDLDPRKLVHPDESFNAVISIKSAAADATGFKLNVCYRLAGDELRCAIEDFK